MKRILLTLYDGRLAGPFAIIGLSRVGMTKETFLWQTNNSGNNFVHNIYNSLKNYVSGVVIQECRNETCNENYIFAQRMMH